MKKLGFSEEEIKDILDCDKRIDKGEKLFELAPELEKGAKKARQADRKKTTTPPKRERKPDEDKRKLITSIISHLESTNIEIVNPEREFLFMYNGKKYKIVLSCPRT